MNEKEELNAKLKSLENKLFNLQQDLNKKVTIFEHSKNS
jgi:hypothetical protein